MVGPPASKNRCADRASRENVAMISKQFIEALHETAFGQLIDRFWTRLFWRIKQSFRSEDLAPTPRRVTSLSTLFVSYLLAGCSFHSTQWEIARTLFVGDPVEIKADWYLYRSEKMERQLYALLDRGNTVFTDGAGLFLVFDGWDVIQSEDANAGRSWRMVERPSGDATGCSPSVACEVEYIRFSTAGQLLGSERLGCTAWLVASQYKGFFKTCQGENRVYDYKILLDDTGSITQIDWNALGTQWQLRRSSNSS